MHSKRTYAALSLLAALATVLVSPTFTGCQSTGGGTNQTDYITPQRVESVAALGAYAAVVTQPDKRDAFLAAQLALSTLIATDKWDLNAAVAVILQSGLDKLTSEEATIIIMAVPLFSDAFLPGAVDFKKVEYVRALIVGAHRGFALGLGNSVRTSESRVPQTPGDPVLNSLKAAARNTRK